MPPPLTPLLIDPNNDSWERIALLPGIGPARARAVVEHRRKAGPFHTLWDLETVPGIGPATVARIRGLVRLGQSDGKARGGGPRDPAVERAPTPDDPAGKTP